MKRVSVSVWGGFLVACQLFVGPALSAEPQPGKQVETSLDVKFDGQTGKIPYLIYLPEEYGKTKQSWPVMLFLHGRGESFGPLSLVKKWGPPRLVEQGQLRNRYIIVSPQCPRRERWTDAKQQAFLIQLLTQVLKTHSCDAKRVYLTGLSLGGYGSWRLAADHPELFAAVAPVCGGGKPADAEQLKGLPIWAFHGDQDRAVPFQRSVEMVEAIKKAGGMKARLTTLEFIGHNCWSATYATPELYSWFDKHRRK